MVSASRVCVQLPWAVQYVKDGTTTLVPAAAPFEWVDVNGIHGELALLPGQAYVASPGSGFERFVWAGPITTQLLAGVPSLEVAVLEYEQVCFLVPLQHLAGDHGTDWDRRITMLAWQTYQSDRIGHEVLRKIA